MRERCHATEALEEVEDDALGGEQRAHRPAQAQQRRGGLVAEAPLDDLHVKPGDQLDAEALVVGAADHFDDRQAADDADVFLKERADADGTLGNEQPAGDVVVAQVLALGELDEVANLVI